VKRFVAIIVLAVSFTSAPPFRNALSAEESKERTGGYEQDRSKLGRYGMTIEALKEAGMLDEKTGKWTGKYGVWSKADFLKNRTAQEKAFSDHFDKLGEQLEAAVGEPEEKSPVGRIGQKIQSIEGEFEISLNGLYVAAHSWGARMLREYLDFEEANGWNSEASLFPVDKLDAFEEIETRLREFQNIEVSRYVEEMPPPDRSGGKMTHLMHYLGTKDYQAILDDPDVKADLERQVGSEIPRLKRYMLDRNTVNYSGGYLVLSGFGPNLRQDRRGIVVVNIDNGEVIAAIYDHGMRTLYTRKANPPVQIPPVVWNWVYTDQFRWVPPKENFDRIER
jgi:hypothetical protein